MITKEEELALIVKSQEGCVESRNALVLAHKGYIGHRANAWNVRTVSKDDIFQVAVIGFMRSIDHYDQKRQIRLCTYARWWIFEAITRWLKTENRLIKNPSRFPKETPWQQFGEDANGNCLSLSVIDDKPDPLYDFENLKVLKSGLRCLSKVQRRVLKQRFLNGMKLREIGAELGVCKERVRQIQDEAIEHLREYFAKKGY